MFCLRQFIVSIQYEVCLGKVLIRIYTNRQIVCKLSFDLTFDDLYIIGIIDQSCQSLVGSPDAKVVVYSLVAIKSVVGCYRCVYIGSVAHNVIIQKNLRA